MSYPESSHPFHPEDTTKHNKYRTPAQMSNKNRDLHGSATTVPHAIIMVKLQQKNNNEILLIVKPLTK